MTDKEMLEAMRSMLEAEREHTGRMMDEKLKRELAPIKEDVSTLKGDVSTLKEDVSDIKQRVVKIEITQENIIIPNIQLAYEGIGGINERLSKLDKIEAEQEAHDDRIWALEQVVKAK